MIRFLPDSWLEALLRPFAMAYPGGAIYVETIAPDFRFVFAIVLGLAWLFFRVRAQAARARTLGLLALCGLAFVPWLLTSGNGRYFIPVLLLVGPLCIALLHHLPVTPSLKVSLAILMIALQAFLLHENEPWNSWGLVEWREPPAFGIEVPKDLEQTPATYLTLTGISYSLIAPHFHPQSRWMGLASQQSRSPDSPVGRRARAFLAAADKIFLIFPSLAGQSGTMERPPSEIVEAMDLSLMEYDLVIAKKGACRMLPSSGLTAMGQRPGAQGNAEPPEARGFWVCPLLRERPERNVQRDLPTPEVEAAFAAVERACPRLFPPGQAATTMLPIGARRFYVSSDMRLYVLNEGRVIYKYMRALNSVELGTRESVVAPDFKMDCNNVRGRSGLPWDREI